MEISTNPDQGGRRLAGLVLEAAGRGDHANVAALIAPLDVDQLRSLVTVLAAQADQTMPDTLASGPEAVCERTIAAAAQTFGTTPEAIVGNERNRTVSDARAVAMTVAREAGLSLPAIAERFHKDHASVIHAVRRTAERPRLEDAAARISEHLQRRFSAALPRPSQDTAAREAPAATSSHEPSAFEPTGIVEHAVVAAAKEFDTTAEVLLGVDRTRAAADARAVAMTAARMHGQSLPRIAGHFHRDHTTVLQATRRIEKTPPLRALAAKITADLPHDLEEHHPREHQDAATVPPTSENITALPSPGAREARRAREQQPDRAPLRIAP